MPDPSYPSYFLDTFGRPRRAIACECKRGNDPNLSQALHLMNGDLVNRKLADPKGRLAGLLKDPKVTDEALIQTLYRVTFARPATESEVAAAKRMIASAPSRDIGTQDLLSDIVWAPNRREAVVR